MNLSKNQLLTVQQALGYAVMFAKTEEETAEFALLKIDIDEALEREKTLSSVLSAVKSIYKEHKKILDILKEKRANSQQERLTDEEMKSMDTQIIMLARILSDLYRGILHIN